MERYAEIDKKIENGYTLMMENKYAEGCDKWLSAWDDIKALLVAADLKEILELDNMFDWSQFISNFIQDLEMELGNAGQTDNAYYYKRIMYCRELLAYCSSDQLLTENTRRAIAESYGALGNFEECDRLFEKWLQADPEWGWGYIGWADCYTYGPKGEEQYDKAQEILSSALGQAELRDRPYVLDALLRCTGRPAMRRRQKSWRRNYASCLLPAASRR